MREENEPDTFKDSLPENPLKDETENPEKPNDPFWNRKGHRYLVQNRFEKTHMGWLMTPRQLIRTSDKHSDKLMPKHTATYNVVEHKQKLYSR